MRAQVDTKHAGSSACSSGRHDPEVTVDESGVTSLVLYASRFVTARVSATRGRLQQIVQNFGDRARPRPRWWTASALGDDKRGDLFERTVRYDKPEESSWRAKLVHAGGLVHLQR